MRFKKTLLLVTAAAGLLAGSCGNKKSQGNKDITPSDIREPGIDMNRSVMKKESDDIDQYVKRSGWEKDMKVSGTGLRYMIYQQGTGEQAGNGKFATVKYKITLLDGRECYSSEKDGPKEFLIGQDNVETGLHEGVAMMKVGDKAIFILPSHLAHGLMGDYNKIPPRSSVVYDIELVKLR
jgi:FKBP-type peptidyl-prolyl cis-trans isomerase FkpA